MRQAKRAERAGNVRNRRISPRRPSGKRDWNVKSFLKKSALCSASCLQALSVVGLVAGAAAISAPAMAQDYTSGVLTGVVTDDAGNPVAGATVTLTSGSQGFTRTATTSNNGRFTFANLPTGSQYSVEVNAAGMDLFTATDISVLASETAELSIGLTSTGNEIVVLGSTIVQDFTSTTTGVNINVDDLVKTVPISRDLTSVALLAPGTSSGDSAFGNLASIGGSSVAENAYYVNGLNITNFDNYLGAANVPFDFYETVEIKSGGYPAEFGRATGGVVSTTTKSGSNDFFAAAHAYWSPNFLRAESEDERICAYDTPPTAGNPNPNITCENDTNRAFDTLETRSLVLEAGGPIIRDRLFIYGMTEFRKDTSRTIDRSASTAYLRNSDDPFWGVKVDAYPLDNHHLEFTIFDSTQITTRSDNAYSEVDGVPQVGIASSLTEFRSGGLSYVGKYTGNFTDWFTLSAAYGVMEDRFDNLGVAGDAGAPYFVNASGTEAYGVGNGSFYNGQRVLSTSFPYNTKREFYRADADLFVTAFGEHHIRFGFDVEQNTLTRSTVRTGGGALYSAGILSEEAYLANTGGVGGAGAALLVRPGDVVEVNYFNSGGTFDAKNTAFYIQDEWDITDRLTVSAGVRRDDFSVDRADGVELVNLDKNYAPRLGLTYDVWPDQSGRFKAFYGVYYLPVASNTAFRMTGYEYYIRERYEIDGIGANGLPILGDQVTDDPSYQSACPISLTPVSSGQYCNVTGDGSVADPSALIASNLKATKMDEIIVGYEHNFREVPMFGDLNVSIDYTRRRLKLNAEDAAIDAAVLAWCDEQGIAGCEDTWTGFHQYTILNPGQPVTVALDGLDGQEVTFTPEQLGYPPASRKYDAVTLQVDRPWDGVWTLSGSYTWSKARGNSEGYVQSDFGQDDAGITQDFDQPGFIDGAYGYLPSHRRHNIKVWGAVQLFEGFTVGSNVSLRSPRPLSCFGHHPTDPFANAYGAAARYCTPANGTLLEDSVLSPRGTAQESDWIFEADMKVAYEVGIPSGQLVRFRVDVFNLFNSQGVEERDQVGELSGFVDTPDGIWYPINPNYGEATLYQSPRQVRLGVDIEF